MLHFTMTGNTAVTNMWERKINQYVEKMPDGKFVDLYTDENIHCCGIALLVSGKVVALNQCPLCVLFPILYNRNAEMLSLSTWGVGDLNHNTNQTWEEAVEEHNINRDKIRKTDDVIVAYYIFDQYEDHPKKEDTVKDEFDELDAIRDKFMKSHEERMRILQDATDSLNTNMNQFNDEFKETDRQLEQISKDLDELLNS